MFKSASFSDVLEAECFDFLALYDTRAFQLISFILLLEKDFPHFRHLFFDGGLVCLFGIDRPPQLCKQRDAERPDVTTVLLCR